MIVIGPLLRAHLREVRVVLLVLEAAFIIRLKMLVLVVPAVSFHVASFVALVAFSVEVRRFWAVVLVV